MSKEQAQSRTGDPETDDILAEMEQEGEALPTFADAPEDDQDDDDSSADQDGDTDDDQEDDDSADDDDSAGDGDADDEDADDEADDGDDQEGDEEGQDDDDDSDDDSTADDESGDDDTANVPLWKRNKALKKQLKDAKDEIDKLTKATTEADVDAQIDAFSKKHKVSKDAAKEMIEMAASLAAKQVGIDPELKATIDRVVNRDKETRFWDDQGKAYAKDFKSNVAPLATRDGKNAAKVQARLQELAFKPENVKKSLVTLYLETYSKKGKPARKITSEGNRVHGRVNGKNTENLNPEDIAEMSDEEFDTFSDGLGKDSKSRIVRH